MHKYNRYRLIGSGFIALLMVSFAWLWLGETGEPSGVFAASKSIQPSYQLFAAPYSADGVRAAFEGDPAVADWLGRLDHEFIQAVPLTTGEARGWLDRGCAPAGCAHLLYYNYTDGGTLEGVVDLASSRVIDLWQDPAARPLASSHTLETALAIAREDEAVRAVLGELSAADIMMVPMNIWLLDNDCLEDWCVDLTFHDPAGSGKIFHVTVNLEREEVARTFYTRGRPSRPFRDLTPQRNAFSDGCEENFGWSVCWQMTAHDGVEFFDATFNGRSVFSSAKVGQVEVWYPSWPGGYRDEIGHSASVPPYFDTTVEEFEDRFEVRQLFTEFTRWPNCICCYRYEQIMTFFEDGMFEARTVSYGPGCDDLSVYQPMWRIDLDLDGPEGDQAFVWSQDSWVEAVAEQEFEMILDGDLSPEGSKVATFDGDLHYRWEYEPDDPLGLDEAKMFLLRYGEQEGENPILTGPANTFQPPRQWIDGDPVSGENLVMWFVPLLKTKKGGPWYCMPEPGPDGAPCEAVLRAIPAGPLPSPEELAAQLAEADEAEAEAAADEPAGTPIPPTPTPAGAETAAPSAETTAGIPGGIEGEDVETVMLNAGCAACHVIGQIGDHGKVGPDLTNIAAVAETRDPDLTAREYIRRAILYPNEYITPDCPNGECLANIMPDYYGERLTAAQLEEIVDYLMAQDGTGMVRPVVEDTAAGSADAAPKGASATPAPGGLVSGEGITIALIVILIAAIAGVLIFVTRRLQQK